MLYKGDMSDKNSVGIGREHISYVIRYLEGRITGTYSLADRLDMRRSSMGITLKDYQGRRLYIPNKEVSEAMGTLYRASLSVRNPGTKPRKTRRNPSETKQIAKGLMPQLLIGTAVVVGIAWLGRYMTREE